MLGKPVTICEEKDMRKTLIQGARRKGQRGWTVVSMKDGWKQIFAFEHGRTAIGWRGSVLAADESKLLSQKEVPI